MISLIFTVGCALCVALLVWAEHRCDTGLRWIAKTAASAAFVSTAIAAGALESGYGIWVLTALVLCMAGDVLLIPKGENTFLAGMGAFAAGHGAYIGTFLWTGLSADAASTPLLLIAIFGMALFAALSLHWLWPHLDDFRGPVAGYTLIIAAMVAASVLAAPPGQAAPSALVITGAVVFAVSDLTVARDQFVSENFANKAIGLPLYYSAQLLIAQSV